MALNYAQIYLKKYPKIEGYVFFYLLDFLLHWLKLAWHSVKKEKIKRQ